MTRGLNSCHSSLISAIWYPCPWNFWSLDMFLTPALTFSILGLLFKRLCNICLAYKAHVLTWLTSALILSPSMWQWLFSSHTQPPLEAGAPNELCMRSGSADNWFRTLTRSHYFLFLCLHLSSRFEKTEKTIKFAFPNWNDNETAFLFI
jgi:hypothetical protein